MAREIEVRRHTDDEDDLLSQEGVGQALEIGRKLRGGYEIVVSTGAQRATQTAACFLAGLGETVPRGVVVNAGLRSDREDRWKEAYQEAGSGELSAFRSVAPDFVEEEAERLGSALREVLESLSDGGRALVVGHSPTSEAAVLGLTGEEVGPLSKGAGVLVVEDNGTFRVQPLDS
ncbi:MAG: histidine phosphatase family protein [Actinomycetota bacterium]|nr:histidine phosphatase family protein [Actinomycetota bacterium]